MAKGQTTQATYAVSIYRDPSAEDALRITFVPTRTQPVAAREKRAPPAPEYIVSVLGRGDQTKIKWIRPLEQSVPVTVRQELEEEARKRVTARCEWVGKLDKLVATVKGWADELGWATKIVDKKMEDPEIGEYTAPALLLQQETARLFLEPVARTAPGTEGVVDLYLMPSYEDIASLYYYNSRWNVHYLFNEVPAVAKIRAAGAKPLTKATLAMVFDKMRTHAA